MSVFGSAPKVSAKFTSDAGSQNVSVSRLLDTATRVDGSGFITSVLANTQRIDFDPVSLSCRGLLIEEGSTNFLIRSQEFSNSAWTKDEASVSLVSVQAPSGSASVEKVTPSINPSTGHRVRQSLGAGTAVTNSAVTVYAKADGYPWLKIRHGAYYANFDLANGVVGLSGGSGVSSSIRHFRDGWYRCELNTGALTDFNLVYFYVATTDNAGLDTVSFSGDGSGGILLWGAQREAKVLATSYIPNLASIRNSRNADDATLLGFANFWRANKGSALVDALPSVATGIRPLLQFDDATADNIISLRGNTTNPELYIRAAGSDQAQIDAGTIAADTSYRIAGAWATDDCAASLNSNAVVTDAAATIPVVTQARLGSDGTNYLNGHIKAIEYYDERVLNASLQVLSSAAGYRSIIGSVFRDSIIS